MQLRVLIIETSDAMRDSIAIHIESLGHEVITASSAEMCPHYHEDNQACRQENACGDVIILGQELPATTGIDYIERRLAGGCRGAAANNAIICRPWSHNEQRRADALGCRFFETPILLAEITVWLKDIEARTPVERTLTPLVD